MLSKYYVITIHISVYAHMHIYKDKILKIYKYPFGFKIEKYL